MNASDRNSSQTTPNIQEIAQTLFIEIRQLIDAAKQRAAVAVISNAELVHKPEDPIRHHLEQLRQEQQILPDLLLKDPHVLDFLDISDRYLEKVLENAILRDIEKFLLELGAGFTFVARQIGLMPIYPQRSHLGSLEPSVGRTALKKCGSPSPHSFAAIS